MKFIKKAFDFISPPQNWKIPVLVVCSILIGMFGFLFYVSKASSYLSDSPTTCVNCHIMAPQYATWQHSSHGRVTNCNDCHVPQNNIFSHYFFKAKDGMRHATIFTLHAEPQVIRIHEAGMGVVQENCKRCHEHVIENVKIKNITYKSALCGEGKLCWECHREVPHGRVNSLSSVPNARVPYPESPVPDWLKKAEHK